MRLLRSVGRDDVLAALARGRGLTGGSAPWTLKFIDQAERQFGSVWRESELDDAEASRIVLPAHAGEPCKGDRLTLVDERGASVSSAAKTLRSIANDYARENANCWSRINSAADAPFSTIILTTAPLDTNEHRHLPTSGVAELFHLDGFHRLVGWAFAERLIPGARIRAHVAGIGPVYIPSEKERLTQSRRDRGEG